MRIIDAARAEADRARRAGETDLAILDPVIHVTDGHVWTLGMVIPMWQFVFERSHSELCERGIPF